MTKDGIFYHYMSHLTRNKKNMHITVNDSRSPIPQAEENKKQYTARDVKRADCGRRFQKINGQPVKQILNAFDKKILYNLPIMQEDFGMAEDIYKPSVSYLQGKTVLRNIQHVEAIVVTNYPKGILDRYKNFNLWCDLMYINGIGFLNTIPRHIMFATGSMIQNRNSKNIEDLIKQVNKICLQCGFKTIRIHADSKFEPLREEIANFGIPLNFAPKKEHVPEIEQYNCTVK